MRWVTLPVLFVLLSGCLQADETVAADGVDAPEDHAEDPYTAFDDRVSFISPGTVTTRKTFELGDAAYDTVRLEFHDDDSTWSGDFRLWVESPSGQEITFLQGSGAGSDGTWFNTGSITSGGSLPYERGTWKVTLEGTGNADMHVSAEVR